MSPANEVSVIFPRSVAVEIDSSLRTMKDLPDGARTGINSHLKELISAKRTALGLIMNEPGNTEAYFHVGMLFIWEMMRTSVAGTVAERMSTLSTAYQTPEGPQIVGHVGIGKYFIQKYLDQGDSDSDLVNIAKTLFGLVQNR